MAFMIRNIVLPFIFTIQCAVWHLKITSGGQDSPKGGQQRMSEWLPSWRRNPWLIFYTFTKITFKSFLVNIYSLGHERRKTIHTLDFHRKKIWTSLNTNVLFVLTLENLNVWVSQGHVISWYYLLLFLRQGLMWLMVTMSCWSFCFHSPKRWDYSHEPPCWVSVVAGDLARALCMLGKTLSTVNHNTVSNQPQRDGKSNWP